MKTDLLFSSFPFIGSEELTLSQIQESDSEQLAELLGVGRSPAEFLRTGEAAFAGRLYIQLGIYSGASINELLGTIKIGNFDYKLNSASIDFSMREIYQNKTLTEKAVMAAVKYLFERIDINRIYAELVDSDPLWERVLERCGFTREGVIRKSVYVEGHGAKDFTVYAMMKDEYAAVADSTLIERDGELSIVRMTGKDYELMAKWLTDERVLKYYDGRDKPSGLDTVIEQYRPKVIGQDNAVPCMMRSNGVPIGYIQYYPITEEQAALKVDGYKAPFGTDLFIGEGSYRNKGLGPRILRTLCKYLFSEMGADVVVGDPQTWNQRSINAFVKAGFTQETILPDHELHEGKLEANVIMHRVLE